MAIMINGMMMMMMLMEIMCVYMHIQKYVLTKIIHDTYSPNPSDLECSIQTPVEADCRQTIATSIGRDRLTLDSIGNRKSSGHSYFPFYINSIV